MGIPRLMKDLLPYTERATLGPKLESHIAVNVTALVIDGPSLVYEVYRRQMRSVVDLKIPLAYHEINEAIVELLDELQNRGVEIKKIYFDGALPTTKRDIRLERLEKHRQDLENFTKMQLKLAVKEASSQKPANGKALLQVLPSSTTRTPKALEPPFMVASAIEHLRQTVYGSSVDLIPDEAEAACVMYASQRSSVAMLSSDTDLVVFPQASVKRLTLVLLRTLEEAETATGESALMADCLRPAEISRRLRISSLHFLAYRRYIEPSASSSIVRRAARTTSTIGSINISLKFLAEYDCINEVKTALSTKQCSVHLDPRLSELRSQYRKSRHSLDVLTPMHMYLPALFEDPAREAPWQHGSDLRQLAYSLLNFSVPSKLRRRSIMEYQRRGWRVSGQAVEILGEKDLSKVFGEDTNLLQNVKTGEDAAGIMKSWQQLALQAVEKRRGEDGRFNFLPATHLSACIQAVIYSLRLLKQAAELLIITAPTSQLVPQNLLDKLATMPALADLMDTTRDMYAAR